MNISQKPPTTMTSREFNQDTARAKRAAKSGPVIITERGKPAFVVLSIEEFERLEAMQGVSDTPNSPQNLAEALADHSPGGDFEFEPPRLSDDWGLRIPTFD